MELNFKPVEFRKTTHSELRPPIFDGDHTHGDDYASGQLLSMQVAKNALLFVVRFSAGPDAEACKWPAGEFGDVEFLVMKQKRYVGSITRQAPERFCSLGLEKAVVLDGLGQGPGSGGRYGTHFFATRFMRDWGHTIPLTVTVYFGLGWFGGWKEIVVKVPKKDLYVGYP